MVFWGNTFSVGKFDGKKKCPSLTWAEKNILFALWALKSIVFVEKNYVATTCREKNFPFGFEAKNKYFDCEKNHSPSPL